MLLCLLGPTAPTFVVVIMMCCWCCCIDVGPGGSVGERDSWVSSSAVAPGSWVLVVAVLTCPHHLVHGAHYSDATLNVRSESVTTSEICDDAPV